MQALKKCMRWDEEVFGLELDLERFMIVAVSDFNAGAMENKGLNIFNTRFILARADTATDYDYLSVDRVVAHEYFHNWTGNRVTCRDWFQLSLKEGLTVYRDQEYGPTSTRGRSARSRKCARCASGNSRGCGPDGASGAARFLRRGQQLLHLDRVRQGRRGRAHVRDPPRQEGFRRGMDLYFQRHDGQAVTCDDFRARWPMRTARPRAVRALVFAGRHAVVECRGEYDAATKTYTLHVQAACPPTPGQPSRSLSSSLRRGLSAPMDSSCRSGHCQRRQMLRVGARDERLADRDPRGRRRPSSDSYSTGWPSRRSRRSCAVLAPYRCATTTPTRSSPT
jgi:aminopeptidase N